MRPLPCLLGRHIWTAWQKSKDGCGTPGCDHYLRHCTRCPKWQHKLGEGSPHPRAGGLYERWGVPHDGL